MNLSWWLSSSVVALALACSAGATFVVQQYDGPPRPKQSVAILRIRGDQSARLIALDGADANAPIERDVRLHVEVLPGLHTLHVANADEPAGPVRRVAFVAEPGRYYGVGFVRAEPARGAEPRVYELLEDSDAPRRDVTIAKPQVPNEQPER
jgi:hypothetical protein